MAWAGTIVPIDQLDGAFPAAELPAHRAYAESYDFTQFLARRGRWDDRSDAGNRWPFRHFLRALAAGEPPDRAATTAYGRPLSTLFAEWRSDLTGRYMLAPIGLIGLIAWIALAILLAFAWARRRRQNRARLLAWELEERGRAVTLGELGELGARPAAAAPPAEPTVVVAPPYVAWPGEDPLAAEPDEDDRPTSPRLWN